MSKLHSAPRAMKGCRGRCSAVSFVELGDRRHRRAPCWMMTSSQESNNNSSSLNEPRSHYRMHKRVLCLCRTARLCPSSAAPVENVSPLSPLKQVRRHSARPAREGIGRASSILVLHCLFPSLLALGMAAGAPCYPPAPFYDKYLALLLVACSFGVHDLDFRVLRCNWN